MATLQKYDFTTIPAGTGQSDEMAVGHVVNKTVYLFGGVYTADIEISHDGVLWQVAGNGSAISVTAAGKTAEITETAAFMRINVTGFTSGTPAAQLQAHSSTEGS